jgi:microcystin-dependent protein
MATALQLRRGTTAQNNAFTGAAGELSYDTQTEALIVHDGSTAGGFEIMPSGSIIAFGGAAAPDAGWLLCAGADINRTTYARLFAVIGTAYGTGDGSSTFGLPDLRDRVLLGKGTNNSTLGTETGSAAASSVITNATGVTSTGTTGSTTNSLSLTSGTFATSAKDSATGSATTNVTNTAHTHSIPALTVPALATTLPSSVVNFIIKI